MSLGKVLDFRDQENGKDTLLRMRKLLLDNINSNYPQLWDFKTIIGVSLALATFETKDSLPSLEDIISWSGELYTEAQRSEYDRMPLECYLYFVMFNWPTDDGLDDIRCSLGTLKSAMGKLKEAFYQNYPRQSQDASVRQKVTTIYHLGKGRGISQYAHFQELHGRQGKRTIKGELLWSSLETARRLKILKGILRDQGHEVHVEMRSTEGSVSSVAIPSGMPIHDKSLWNKEVYFFLGFSWAGPRAFGITGDDPSNTIHHQQGKLPTLKAHQRSAETYPHSKDISRVMQLLDQIKKMKEERSRGVLVPLNQWRLVYKEKELQKQLDEYMTEAFDEIQPVYCL